MKKKTISLLCILLLVCSLASCGQSSVPAQPAADSVTAGAVSTDLLRSDEHQNITWDLIPMTEHEPELEEKGYYHNSLMYLESGDRKVRRVIFRHLRLAVDRDQRRRHYRNGYRRIRGGDPCGNVPGIFREF